MWKRAQCLRRHRCVCITAILAIYVVLLAYVKLDTGSFFKTSFAGILSYRLFPYQRTCDINSTLTPWTVHGNVSWECIEDAISGNLELGGRFEPDTHDTHNPIVVIIPQRNREQQLKSFMRYMHPYLQRKQITYTIIVVEQTAGVDFNKGLLLNIGFVEALKFTDVDCFIFHDVDLLPERNNTPYTCDRSPVHMASAIDYNNYTLPYPSYFGGICAIKREHFQIINGLSNQYFGWGGEDDDFQDRLKMSHLNITRLSKNEGRYHMLSHAPEKQNPQKLDLFKTMRARRTVDGLNSLKYKVVKKEFKPLYTWILVDIDESVIKTYDQKQLQKINEELNKNSNSLKRKHKTSYKRNATIMSSGK